VSRALRGKDSAGRKTIFLKENAAAVSFVKKGLSGETAR
jgi:hypothetical protein